MNIINKFSIKLIYEELILSQINFLYFNLFNMLNFLILYMNNILELTLIEFYFVNNNN